MTDEEYDEYESTYPKMTVSSDLIKFIFVVMVITFFFLVFDNI